jgi:ferrous iron transport protein B
MLSSYACAVPGVLGCRTIEDPKARLTTILISPLMSCSARLPVYVLLIGAFVEPRYGPWIAGLTLVVMHFVGLAVAIPVALVLNRLVLRTRPAPFVLEMPSYRVPRLRDVLWRMWERGREFLIRAGTVIFAMTIIIWALLYFPRPAEVEQQVTAQFTAQVAREQGVDEAAALQSVEASDELASQLEMRVDAAYLEQSFMGRLGQAVQPVFAPAGFDWKITVGVLASFPAREVIIATMGTVYSLGGEVDEESGALRGALAEARWPDGSPVFTIPVVFAIMVFFALCLQCGATVAVIAREASWAWAGFSFAYMTVLAWIGAVVTYQVGSLLIA